ncbi:MAG: hypothetical protein GF344_18865 [Chitinivibrionales bacterium]|nr:hypothetical protein [Chitinivibrionales bacterium]
MNKNRCILLICLFCLNSAWGNSITDSAWSYYDRRAEGSIGLVADSSNINKAMELFKRSLEANENDPVSATGLLQCYYYKGRFVYTDEIQKRRCFTKGIEIGETQMAQNPKTASLRYWTALLMGEEAKTKSKFTAAREGVATKFRNLMREALSLEPNYLNGMVHMYIARINHIAPRIPFLMPWPSKETSEKYFETALKKNPEKIIIRHFWAAFLKDTKRKGEAIGILQKLVEVKPSKSSLLEDTFELTEAEKLLTKLQQ